MRRRIKTVNRDINALACQLTSWRTGERCAAKAKAARLRPEETAQLVHALTRMMHRRGWLFGFGSNARRRAWIMLALIVPTSLYVWHLRINGGFWLGLECVWIIGASLILPIFTDAVSVLADTDRMTAIGPLAEGLSFSFMRPGCIPALIRLLPRLRATDAHLLSTGQMDCLCRELERYRPGRFWPGCLLASIKYSPSARARNGCRRFLPYLVYENTTEQDAELLIAILRAFEQVGTERQIPTVERIAALTIGNEHDRRVQQAARECLPALHQRAEDVRVRSTLLRPASPDPDGSTLLRPAGSTETDAGVLLRPRSRD